jgi:hypothetical protein
MMDSPVPPILTEQTVAQVALIQAVVQVELSLEMQAEAE